MSLFRDELLSTAEAAELVGVSPATIRAWRQRRVDPGDPSSALLLPPQGLDERGYPVHSAKAVRAAERAVRENGLRRGGVDPRALRKSRTAA